MPQKLLCNMKMKHVLSLSLFFMITTSFISSPNKANRDWNLVTEKEDLKVYKRSKEGSKFQEVKIVNIFHAKVEDMLAELDDIEGYVHWVYKCTESYTVKKISNTEIVSYSLADMPSPIWDRDIVSHSKYWYDEKTATHHYDSRTPENDENYVPKNPNAVRVKDYKALWSVKDLGNGRLESVNIIHMEPGGSIPAWLNNMVITKGPIKTMKELQRRLDEK